MNSFSHEIKIYTRAYFTKIMWLMSGWKYLQLSRFFRTYCEHCVLSRVDTHITIHSSTGRRLITFWPSTTPRIWMSKSWNPVSIHRRLPILVYCVKVRLTDRWERSNMRYRSSVRIVIVAEKRSQGIVVGKAWSQWKRNWNREEVKPETSKWIEF